ncbi:MAG: hypothetical protein KAY59_08865, partial [Acidobacteria bacterium]|nr:hypothetical protein [Acidobacteriota bacterium]
MLQLITFVTLVSPLAAQNPPAQTPPAAAAQAGGEGAQAPGGAGARRAPRPYDQVITARAKSERGVLAVHK